MVAWKFAWNGRIVAQKFIRRRMKSNNLAKKFCTACFLGLFITFPVDIVSATAVVVDIFSDNRTIIFIRWNFFYSLKYCLVSSVQLILCMCVRFICLTPKLWIEWRGRRKKNSKTFSYFSIDTAKHRNYCSKWGISNHNK